MATQTLEQLARGSWQRQIAYHLSRFGCISNPVRQVRGRASSYAPRYAQSWQAFLDRARAAGYTVVREPGPKGGEWSATYYVFSQ